MKALTARDAKYGFGRMIDLACAEPVVVAKHRCPLRGDRGASGEVRVVKAVGLPMGAIRRRQHKKERH